MCVCGRLRAELPLLPFGRGDTVGNGDMFGAERMDVEDFWGEENFGFGVDYFGRLLCSIKS